jgi:hypothetical protein
VTASPNADYRTAWCVVDYDGQPLPGEWPTRADAIDKGLCGRYLLSGHDVRRVSANDGLET